MNLFVSLYLAALFVALTPGILLTLPKGGKKLTVAVVHGLVFAVVYYLTHKAVWRATSNMDGFRGAGPSAAARATQDAQRAATAAAFAAALPRAPAGRPRAAGASSAGGEDAGAPMEAQNQGDKTILESVLGL